MLAFREKRMSRFIGRRIFKTGVAVSLSLIITHLLGIASNFAGVVALIGLKQTTRKTYEYARTLILGSILSLILGAAAAHLFGSSDLTFGVATIIDIALIVSLGWGEGMILAVVEMYNIMAQDFSSLHHAVQYSIEQLVILLIGVGASLLMNLLMPQKFIRHLDEGTTAAYRKHRERLEALYKALLHPSAGIDRSAAPFQENVLPAEASLNQNNLIVNEHLLHLSEIAERGKENTLHSSDALEYSRWGEKIQLLHHLHHLLHEMEVIAERLKGVYPHSPLIAKSIRLLAIVQERPEGISPSSFRRLMAAIDHLYDHFRASPLPQTREEFETRSSLFHLYLFTKEYLDTLHRLGRL